MPCLCVNQQGFVGLDATAASSTKQMTATHTRTRKKDEKGRCVVPYSGLEQAQNLLGDFMAFLELLQARAQHSLQSRSKGIRFQRRPLELRRRGASLMPHHTDLRTSLRLTFFSGDEMPRLLAVREVSHAEADRVLQMIHDHRHILQCTAA